MPNRQYETHANNDIWNFEFELTSGTARVWAYWVSLLDKIIGCSSWFRIESATSFSQHVTMIWQMSMPWIKKKSLSWTRQYIMHHALYVPWLNVYILNYFCFHFRKKSIQLVNMLWYPHPLFCEPLVRLSTSTYYISSHHCPLIFFSSRSTSGWSRSR